MSGETRTRPVLIGVVVVIAIATGIAVGFTLDKQEVPSTALPDPAVSTDSSSSDHVSAHYARTEEGAAAAAAHFNSLSGTVKPFELDELTRAMQAIAAPEWRDEAAKEARNGYDYVTGTYGDDADVTSAALRYEVLNFSPQRATVNLWAVTLLAGSKRPNVESAWGLVTLDLTWVDEAWRIAGIESSPGPSPVDLPSSGSQRSTKELMREFSEYVDFPAS